MIEKIDRLLEKIRYILYQKALFRHILTNLLLLHIRHFFIYIHTILCFALPLAKIYVLLLLLNKKKERRHAFRRRRHFVLALTAACQYFVHPRPTSLADRRNYAKRVLLLSVISSILMP